MPSYQLAISNIAWQKDDDETVYAAMQQAGFTGLELAPTRIFSEAPYENLTSALLFGGYLKNRWGFSVPSLQSIWYGQKGNIFDPADTEHLLDYTAQAFQFAHSLNCPSLVFGCPKNRMRPLGGQRCRRRGVLHAGGQPGGAVRRASGAGGQPADVHELPERHRRRLCARQAAGQPRAVGQSGPVHRAGAGRKLQSFIDDMQYVSHVHISEPGLVPIERRPEHKELALLLGAVGYRGFVSVEMAHTDVDTIRRTMDYIAEVFA